MMLTSPFCTIWRRFCYLCIVSNMHFLKPFWLFNHLAKNTVTMIFNRIYLDTIIFCVFFYSWHMSLASGKDLCRCSLEQLCKVHNLYTIQFVALTNKQDILVLFSASCFHHASSKNLLKLVVIVSQGMGHTNPREDSHPLPIWSFQADPY